MSDIQRAMDHANRVLPAVAAECIVMQLAAVEHVSNDRAVMQFVARVLALPAPSPSPDTVPELADVIEQAAKVLHEDDWPGVDWDENPLRQVTYTLRARALAAAGLLATRPDTVAEFCAERADYITSINNCHPDNYADYHRWQGHAEARRQLAQKLGLPVAWPTRQEPGQDSEEGK